MGYNIMCIRIKSLNIFIFDRRRMHNIRLNKFRAIQKFYRTELMYLGPKIIIANIIYLLCFKTVFMQTVSLYRTIRTIDGIINKIKYDIIRKKITKSKSKVNVRLCYASLYLLK